MTAPHTPPDAAPPAGQPASRSAEPPPKRPRDPSAAWDNLPRVVVDWPTCPACGGVNLLCVRTVYRSSECVTRRMKCRDSACGQQFALFLQRVPLSPGDESF